MAYEQALSLDQAAKLIRTVGHQITHMVRGHMGCGKTSIMKMLRQHFGDAYNYVTVDCTQLDVGDVQIPGVNSNGQTMRFLPNEMFVGDGTKPMIIMFDEFGKAPRNIQNVCLPVMLERRVGMHYLHPQSIVFCTTNLSGEGVGDTIQAHAMDRMSDIEVRKPNAEEWIGWGLNNNINPAMLAWAKETTAIFQDFRQVRSPSDNPYIFHPKEQRSKFVTCRGLEFASHVLNARTRIDDEYATQADLSGILGPRGAADLMAYVLLADKLPTFQSIADAPMQALLPMDSPAAMCMVVWTCVGRVDQATFENTLQYITRLPLEIQALYASELMRMRSKQAMATKNRKFTEWVAKNSWALM